MTAEQVQQLRELLAAGKVADEKLNPDRVFLRGWNEGIAFAAQQLEKIIKGAAA
ncbi:MULTISPECIES: hypothetical protein [unclassified Bradyrhizobium]